MAAEHRDSGGSLQVTGCGDVKLDRPADGEAPLESGRLVGQDGASPAPENRRKKPFSGKVRNPGEAVAWHLVNTPN